MPAETTSTTETVTKASAGNVKITVEEYDELRALAARPQTVNYTRIEKTAHMQAVDNQMHGALFMGGGATVFAIGLIQFIIGRKQLKAL